MTTISRDECGALDVRDPLAPMRDQFALADADARGLIYLDGNSLGPLPIRTIARLQQVIVEEWGHDLIASWNKSGWISLAARVGDKIARLIGGNAGEVMVADSTSINLYKALSAALAIARSDGTCPRLVSERTNFPSDLYVADTFARERGGELVLVESGELVPALDHATVLLLTHVNYRTGAMHDLDALTRAAHAAGVVTVWDLSHSAGALPVAVNAADADLAVGCGYKYLNGGPGAPAFIWANARVTAALDRLQWRQPLSGWLGHRAPFAFMTDYQPAPGIQRFSCGTPPVLSLAALECGVDVVLEAERCGGLDAIRDKSIRLTELFTELVETRCPGHDLRVVTPREPSRRGSQVCLAHATAGYPIMQALIHRGVIGDFRAPDILRFGFAPLYTRYVDVWDAVERLLTVLATGEWRREEFERRLAVT